MIRFADYGRADDFVIKHDGEEMADGIGPCRFCKDCDPPMGSKRKLTTGWLSLKTWLRIDERIARNHDAFFNHKGLLSATASVEGKSSVPER